MARSVPPDSKRPSVVPVGRKRPWYLVVALVASYIFGMLGLMSGCASVSFYREPLLGSPESVESRGSRATGG